MPTIPQEILLPLVVLIVLWPYLTAHRVRCPDCGELLPRFYSPFKVTRRMWREGGRLCARCGCEANIAGQKVTADTPLEPFPTRRWTTLAFALLLGAVFMASVRLLSPPMMVAPVAAPPQQAPAVAPVN